MTKEISPNELFPYRERLSSRLYAEVFQLLLLLLFKMDREMDAQRLVDLRSNLGFTENDRAMSTAQKDCFLGSFGQIRSRQFLPQPATGSLYI